MDPQVVHDDYVSGLQRWHQDLLDIGHEQFTVDRTINGHWSGQAVAAQCADKGCRLPVAMRDGGDQALATLRTAVPPRHVGFYPGLIDENEL